MGEWRHWQELWEKERKRWEREECKAHRSCFLLPAPICLATLALALREATPSFGIHYCPGVNLLTCRTGLETTSASAVMDAQHRRWHYPGAACGLDRTWTDGSYRRLPQFLTPPLPGAGSTRVGIHVPATRVSGFMFQQRESGFMFQHDLRRHRAVKTTSQTFLRFCDDTDLAASLTFTTSSNPHDTTFYPACLPVCPMFRSDFSAG